MTQHDEASSTTEMASLGLTVGESPRDMATKPPPMVRLEHLSKTFLGGAQAVEDLSLEVHEGEVFTLLGPSGCGKTTTLRLIAGLEEPTEGSIYFGDKPIVDKAQNIFIRPNNRSVGMVFQSYAIWPHMTVEENVAYPLKLRHISKREIQVRVNDILELVGLEGLQKQPASLLSGGQQQRVALARALVYEPTMLLLDEPFSNLDAKLRDQMRVELKILQSRLKVTVIFVTHDQVEALSLSDRIAVMNHGRVQQVGRPEELYDNPANPFVRDFLGKTILLKGEVSASNPDGQVAVRVDGATDCVLFGRSGSPDPMATGQRVYLAIRPEDMDISESHSTKLRPGMIGGSVETRLFVGERTEYRVNVHDQGTILVYGNRQQMFDPGQEVWLKPHPQGAGVWVA